MISIELVIQYLGDRANAAFLSSVAHAQHREASAAFIETLNRGLKRCTVTIGITAAVGFAIAFNARSIIEGYGPVERSVLGLAAGAFAGVPAGALIGALVGAPFAASAAARRVSCDAPLEASARFGGSLGSFIGCMCWITLEVIGGMAVWSAVRRYPESALEHHFGDRALMVGIAFTGLSIFVMVAIPRIIGPRMSGACGRISNSASLGAALGTTITTAAAVVIVAGIAVAMFFAFRKA